MVRVSFIALLIATSPAAAADEGPNMLAFTEGRYTQAALEATEQVPESPDALAFAARCYLAQAMSADNFIPPQDAVVRAEALARQALETDPDHIEGRLQLAIALSLRARPLTTRQAMKAGYGGDAKDLAKAVLEDDPTNQYAHGFLAIWNIEVVRRGGSIGSSVLGASVKKARRHYESAVAQDNDDASTYWQYARALTALNAKKYRAEIDLALDAAVTSSTDSELERVMQARAQTLKDALETMKRKDVQRLAAEML